MLFLSRATARTHDYTRDGTTSLFAALDLATGRVIGQFHRQHRAIEFHKFLICIDDEVPESLDVHVVLDNYATHRTPAREFLEVSNEDPKPFVWTKSAGEILESVAAFRKRTSNSRP